MPVKKRYWRHGEETIEECAILFPRNLLSRGSQDYDIFGLTRSKDVYLLLKLSDCDWQLRGDDRYLVERLFETDGVIGFSKAYFEGDRIHIVDGYLKSYEGQIIQVNRRAKTVQIRVCLHEKVVLLWLGYEEINHID